MSSAAPATTSPISGSRSRRARDESLILDPDEFYILASKEAVQVPPDYAAEMVPFDPLVGEFRVHYAGFFDPGFGYAGAGGRGARAVLEVRSREVPFILEHGQIVGRLVYEKMLERPDDALRPGHRLELPGAGPEAVEAFPDVSAGEPVLMSTHHHRHPYPLRAAPARRPVRRRRDHARHADRQEHAVELSRPAGDRPLGDDRFRLAAGDLRQGRHHRPVDVDAVHRRDRHGAITQARARCGETRQRSGGGAGRARPRVRAERDLGARHDQPARREPDRRRASAASGRSASRGC